MAKSKYVADRKVTTIKGFEYSKADYFKMDEKTVRRNVLEKMVYKDLKKALAEEIVYTAKKVGEI